MNAYQKLQLLAAQVTGEVIAELQKGKAVWQKPWSSFGLSKNYFSGRPTEPEIEVLINPFVFDFEHEAMEQLEAKWPAPRSAWHA